MYESLKFAKEKKGVFTSDVNEALKVSEKLTVNPIEIQLQELEINEDGTVKNGEERKVTKYGFENLCKILGIPKPFAREIPTELLFHNIKELQSNMGSREVILLEREDGTIANIVKPPYLESSYTDVLSHFSEREDIQYIDINESLLTIALTFKDIEIKAPDIVTDEFVKPDILYVGTWIYNSVLERTSLHMESGFYRTHCQNSYIAPFLGKVRANYLKEPEERLLRFVEYVKCYNTEVLGRIKDNFERFGNKYLYDTEFIKVWKSLSKNVGIAQADILLKIDEPTRKAMMTTVFNRQILNARAKLLGKAVAEPILTNVKAFDMINDITSFAKNLYGVDRYAIEKIGGEWINKIILN